jgi:predicted nucleotidyltransferase
MGGMSSVTSSLHFLKWKIGTKNSLFGEIENVRKIITPFLNNQRYTFLMTREAILTQLNAWLGSKPELQLAMLYGSYSVGKITVNSDIDLGIALAKALTPEERIDYAQELEKLLKIKVDLVDLNQARGLILKEIISANHFLLKRNPDLFAKILLKLWFEEADFGPIRKNIMEVRKSRVFGN